MWHHKFTEVPLAHLRVQLLKTAVCKNPDISEMSASWIDTVLCSQLDLCSLNYVTMLISIIFHTCCRIWIHFVRVKVLHTYTLPNCTSSQCLAHTAHSISFMSPELMHRPSGYLAHCARGKLERVSSSFSKRQRKMLLIAEQRRPFSAHSSRLSMSIRGDECQHISKHAHFLYSVHMRADGAPNAGLQNLPANPPRPVSTFEPSDTVTTGSTSGTDLTATREVCVRAHSGDKDRTSLTGLQREQPCHSLLNNLN